MVTTIRQLIGADPKDLVADLERIREQEQHLSHERELLERVLEILVEQGGEAADWLTDPSRDLLTIGPLRTQILRVLERIPVEQAMQPREVHDLLVEHGNNKVTLDNVRTTMSRMVSSGELFQPEPPVAAFVLAERADHWRDAEQEDAPNSNGSS